MTNAPGDGSDASGGPDGESPTQPQYGIPYPTDPGTGQPQSGQQPYSQPPYGGQQPYGYGPAPTGYGQPPGYGYPPVQPTNDGGATAAMVVGIASLVLACGYGVGLLGSPVAWYLGKSSMNRIDASGGTLGGRGMAQAGFVLGIIGTVLLVLAIIGIVGLVALGTGSLMHSSGTG